MNLVLDNWRILLSGLWATLQIGVVTLVASVLVGLVLGVAICMTERRWIRMPIRGAVELLRAVPLIVNVYFVFFIAPQLGVALSAYMAAVVSLSLWGGANATEIVRGGLQALPRHQRRSARALGLREWEIFLLILLPQAIRSVLPSLAGLLTLLIQSTTIGALVGVPEFLQMSRLIVERTTVMDGLDPSFRVYGFVLVVYFVLCTPLTWLSRELERRLARRSGGQPVVAAPATAGVGLPALP
ncbi:MAG: amino acid ABC transporter permease [Acetobacteraceae bacterium]|nr:amino acid ABC transporter permease [Acetobacteraceae bacterium]